MNDEVEINIVLPSCDVQLPENTYVIRSHPDYSDTYVHPINRRHMPLLEAITYDRRTHVNIHVDRDIDTFSMDRLNAESSTVYKYLSKFRSKTIRIINHSSKDSNWYDTFKLCSAFSTVANAVFTDSKLFSSRSVVELLNIGDFTELIKTTDPTLIYTSATSLLTIPNSKLKCFLMSSDKFDNSPVFEYLRRIACDEKHGSHYMLYDNVDKCTKNVENIYERLIVYDKSEFENISQSEKNYVFECIWKRPVPIFRSIKRDERWNDDTTFPIVKLSSLEFDCVMYKTFKNIYDRRNRIRWAIEILRHLLMNDDSYANEYKNDILNTICLPEDELPFGNMAFKHDVKFTIKQLKIYDFEFTLLTDEKITLVNFVTIIKRNHLEYDVSSKWIDLLHVNLPELVQMLQMYKIILIDDMMELIATIHLLCEVNNASANEVCNKILQNARIPLRSILKKCIV